MQCPSHVSEINAELPRAYCLINLDNMIVFWKTEEEHMQCLHVVFIHFWEHNLKLKPMKCEFFWDEINYLAHHFSREGVRPWNLKAVAEFAPPQTYMEIWAFLGLLGHYQQFIKGFAHVAQPLHNPSLGRCQWEEWVSNTHGRGQRCLWHAKESLSWGPSACFC